MEDPSEIDHRGSTPRGRGSSVRLPRSELQEPHHGSSECRMGPSPLCILVTMGGVFHLDFYVLVRGIFVFFHIN